MILTWGSAPALITESIRLLSQSTHTILTRPAYHAALCYSRTRTCRFRGEPCHFPVPDCAASFLE